MNAPDEMRFLREPGAPALFGRRARHDGAPVLYVHGATFPSGLSVAWRSAGVSWMDDLQSRGFDAWAFDLAGYGQSERYPAMAERDVGPPPLGRAPVAAAQIARVVHAIRAATGRAKVSIVAHSWGCTPAALYATQAPETIDRLCLFGPFLPRPGPRPDEGGPAWRLITIAEQRASFVGELPAGHAPVLLDPDMSEWAPAYLATDPESQERSPPAVKVPFGPAADVAAAWSGASVYDPRLLTLPVMIARGEWDSVTKDADAAWLMARLSHPAGRDVKLPRGTHRMHLETGRDALFDAVGAFLKEASP